MVLGQTLSRLESSLVKRRLTRQRRGKGNKIAGERRREPEKAEGCQMKRGLFLEQRIPGRCLRRYLSGRDLGFVQDVIFSSKGLVGDNVDSIVKEGSTIVEVKLYHLFIMFYGRN